MTGFAIARMLHVLALGIGGAGVATTVLLPSIRRSCAPTDQLRPFHTIAARFAPAVALDDRTGRREWDLHGVAAGSVGALRNGVVLVDARHGRHLAGVHDHAVRGRAARAAPIAGTLGRPPARGQAPPYRGPTAKGMIRYIPCNG